MGGAEKNALNIMNRMNRNKYEIHLILFEKTGRLMDALNEDISIYEVCGKNKLDKAFKLYKIVLSIKPDIIFSTIINANILTGLLSIFYRECLYIGRETTVHSKLLEKKSFLMKKIITLWYRLFISRLNIIIVQSLFMKQELVDYFGLDPTKMIVLGNPISTNERFLQQPDKTAPSCIRLLVVGRLVPLKRIAMLLKVMNRLSTDYHLTIIGDGPERKHLEASIERMKLNNRVTLLGEVSNPMDQYTCSDLLLVASAYDSYPNVMMEALSVGLRVIAFDVPGAINEILSDPVRGRLISDGDYDAYVQAIKDEVCSRYSPERVRNSVKDQNWEQYLTKLEGLLD